MTTPTEIFARTVHDRLSPPRAVTAYAPSNIALSKYWGKRDAALNLPLNSSLSISLGDWGTTTTVAPADRDTLIFNDKSLDPDAPAAAKIWRFVDYFAGPERAPLSITTSNTIPTAAGLASSASGFAALALALDGAFDTALAPETLSMLARMGSGSATRSFWHGFAAWDKGVAPDGHDSHGRRVAAQSTALRIAIVPVDTGPKAHSSRDGMNHTVATSPLFPAWPDRADADCAAVEAAVTDWDFKILGTLAEANALAMHATMMAARPALTYLKPGSWQVLEALWQARGAGLNAYATMDAGANVKLIFESTSTDDVAVAFPQAQIINPFGSPQPVGVVANF
ncbi:MAG: diphosphomevalonate decarboxylase [Pseudomonadota bacterium]